MSDQFAFGLSFADLYDQDGLVRLDKAFCDFVNGRDADAAAKLTAARQNADELDAKQSAEVMLALAPQVDAFLTALFHIEAEYAAQIAELDGFAPVYEAKRKFIQKKAAKAHSPEESQTFDGPALRAELEARIGATFDRMSFAKAVLQWMEEGDEDALDLAARYADWALYTPEGRHHHKAGVLFGLPSKHEPLEMVETVPSERGGLNVVKGPALEQRTRDGFKLTDDGASRIEAMGDAHYCILCHHQGKDSCSKGMKDKDSGDFVKNDLGRLMTGCPLEERISEMQEAWRAGHTIGALGIITLDNPMCAGTGHRICNDCMTSCVYQNQHRDPVEIPQVETRILKDVLALPFGFEILSLLTRWNPFNFARPVPKPASGYSVLIGGLGPAGYTLAHHLLNEGHTVAAVDGLKIEPVNPALSGIDEHGNRAPFVPVKDASALFEPLDERVNEGFGGVAEYGITVRWDKNFLRLNRLLLERREHFALFGGTRLGGTITLDQAFEMGFHHVALCLGAGKPTILNMDNNLARGVRQASDFLMALQLTGAGRKDSVANLQVRLPVAVIGGGLTAIDTATEALAYYPVQVEKFLTRYETLVAEKGEDAVRARFTDEEHAIADEFIAHAKAIRAEKEKPQPNVQALLDSWGGSTLVYRRKLTESPSYRNNHEEITKALEEGIAVAEQWSPVAVELDDFGHAAALKVKHMESGEEQSFPAKTILAAAGTVPNITIAKENHGLTLDGRYFQAVDETGAAVSPEKRNKPGAVQVLAHVRDDGRTISFFGDQHPSFAGNVVGAMGSAKQGYPVVDSAIRKNAPATGEDLLAKLNADLRPTVVAVNRLTPTIVEVVVKAPAAARNFKPGQFFRLQNYEAHAVKAADTTLGMEGIALTGAWVDVAQGHLGMIALEMGGSSNLIAHLKEGERVVVMGPTGAPTETPAGETVLLVGGGLGNAVLFSIGKAFREAGSKVLYFAGYKNQQDRFKVPEVEEAADVVVWCCDSGEPFPPNRPQDKSFIGNIVQCMTAYADGSLGDIDIPLSAVDRIIVIGSDRMMAAVGESRHTLLKPFLKPDHQALASINAPMQCMLKEICAQCLVAHNDPKTGEHSVVFTCFNQDQPMDVVDFKILHERLGQNTVQEKITAQWIAHCLTATG